MAVSKMDTAAADNGSGSSNNKKKSKPSSKKRRNRKKNQPVDNITSKDADNKSVCDCPEDKQILHNKAKKPPQYSGEGEKEGQGVTAFFTPTFLLYLSHFHKLLINPPKLFMVNILHKLSWVMIKWKQRLDDYCNAQQQEQKKGTVQVRKLIPDEPSCCMKFWSVITCLVGTVFMQLSSSFACSKTAQLFCDSVLYRLLVVTLVNTVNRAGEIVRVAFSFLTASAAAIFQKSLPRFLFTLLRSGGGHKCVVVIIYQLARAGSYGIKLLFSFVQFLQKQKSAQRVRFSSWAGSTMASASPSSSSASSTASLSPPSIPDGGSIWISSSVKGRKLSALSSSPPRGQQQVIRRIALDNMTCHMEWIGDLMPSYLSSSEKNIYLTAIIQRLSDWLEDIQDRIVTVGSELNVRLMLACFHAYLQEFSEALNFLKGALESLKQLDDDSRPHICAYTYLLQANFYKINRRKKLMEGMKMKMVEEEAAQDAEKIEGLFRENENKEPFQAALFFTKGMLAGAMVSQNNQIEWYRNATELEPDCDQWLRVLYQQLRKQRRERRSFSLSSEEKRAITRAFELNPDCCLNQSFYASMLEENMKADKNLYLKENKEEIGNEIVSLLTNALEKNPGDKWAHVRLAEVYAYGNFPHLDPKEGKRMFEELEERWPDNSMVLHKFGKYFVITENKYSTALEYFTRALECDESNSPCLMDFLKTSQRLKKGYKYMLEMVEKCLRLKCLHNSGPFVRIMLAKGILLWLLDNDSPDGHRDTRKQEACRAWIEAAEKDAASCFFIAKKITSKYWEVIGEYSIDMTMVMSILTVYRSLANSAGNGDQVNAIDRLISEVENQDQSNRPYFRGGQRNHYLSTSSSRSTVSNSSYVTAKSSSSYATARSQADSVQNWRDQPAIPEQLPPLVGGRRGVFARYEDPFELNFRGGFNAGYNPRVTTTSAQQNGSGRGGNAKKTSYNPGPSVADGVDNWRR